MSVLRVYLEVEQKNRCGYIPATNREYTLPSVSRHGAISHSVPHYELVFLCATHQMQKVSRHLCQQIPLALPP
jgi:hypothetical protein